MGVVFVTFSERIEKHIKRKNVLEIGEVKIHRAYLYHGDYEICIEAVANRKVYQSTVRVKQDVLQQHTGTLSHVLHRATGFVLNS